MKKNILKYSSLKIRSKNTYLPIKLSPSFVWNQMLLIYYSTLYLKACAF